MNNEFPTYDDFKEIKDKYDDLKAKYDVLRESHMKLEQDLKEMTAENAILKDSLKETDSKYLKLSVENQRLKDRNDSLRLDFQELKTIHQSASESIEHVCNDCRKLREENDKLRTKKPDNCENKWADREEAKKFFESLQQEPIKLSPVLSETPSVIINTKSINITFDNHTNNFKEDDAE